MDDNLQKIQTIAIIGGTGKEGKGLAYRWLKAGFTIIIGSRQLEKAQLAAFELKQLTDNHGSVSGLENFEAANNADLVVLTVPFNAHRTTIEYIKPCLVGKILVDVTVPIVPPKITKVQMPSAGSAAQEAVEILGDQTDVVSAFQNISYEHLLNDDVVDCDVLVCGTKKSARKVVLDLVTSAGLVGFDAGPVENSMVVEGLTSILLGINKQYGIQSAGIRITGVPRN